MLPGLHRIDGGDGGGWGAEWKEEKNASKAGEENWRRRFISVPEGSRKGLVSEHGGGVAEADASAQA